jgi:hypothetical protein
MKPDFIEYSPDRFDEGYYCRGERGGFRNYEFDHPDQQEQLRNKWGICQAVPHDMALFVGCARGYEVEYWGKQGKHAIGFDVSKWAIENRYPGTSCHLFDGVTLPVQDLTYDLVCAFDVLTIPPFPIASKLAEEMVRVAKNGIVIRTIVKNWRNWHTRYDGTDGTSYKYQSLNDWDKLFTQSGKFALHTASMAHQYETVFVWKRV